MDSLISKSFNFFKKETVFSISVLLAVISCFFVEPSVNYLNYINLETIILLFVIMIFVEILKNLYVFEILIRKLLLRIKNTRELVFVLVFICFFSSIFITNDVSLIIFVPFTVLAFKKVDRIDLTVITVSLQTIAANIGCMILPIGAPHNIVMYTVSNISFESFFLLLLPYVTVSVIFLCVFMFFIPKDVIYLHVMRKVEFNSEYFFNRVFKGIDYYLLLTFIALFILIGNLENISFFRELFTGWIIGNEVICGIVVSQFISNVPAAILLSGFSNNYEAIIIGINIGGFGTLISSMANLISYKIIVREYGELKGRYFLVSTVLNIALLVILLMLHFFVSDF